MPDHAQQDEAGRQAVGSSTDTNEPGTVKALALATTGAVIDESEVKAADASHGDAKYSMRCRTICRSRTPASSCSSWQRATGTSGFLLSDTVRVYRKLLQSGALAELHLWEGAPHGPFTGRTKGDREQVSQVCALLKSAWMPSAARTKAG